jgi:hypothetical protein
MVCWYLNCLLTLTTAGGYRITEQQLRRAPAFSRQVEVILQVRKRAARIADKTKEGGHPRIAVLF